LEQALALAGDNRPELEKVLARYGQDPADEMKLCAARFLIENMPWHYSYGGAYYEDYVRKVDSMHRDLPIELRMVVYTLPEKFASTAVKLEIRPDIENITADFLIHNIDHSFEVWENSPWLQNLTFENFCEYLLPYRLGHEPLMNWKDSLPDNFRTKIVTIAENLPDTSRDPWEMYKFVEYHGQRNILDYYTYDVESPVPATGSYAFDCMDVSAAYAILWRMAGFAVAVDFLPLWANGNNDHADIAIMDEHNAAGFIPQTPHFVSASKVYRTAFSANRSKLLQQVPGYLPATVRNPFYRDVTAGYFKTTDIKVDVANGQSSVACLGVFNSGWDAVTATEVRGRRATFKDMASGYVYIPFTYKDNGQVFSSMPFHIDAHSQRRYFEPDKSRLQTVTLDRKDKLHDYKIWWSQLFHNARFEASDDINFDESATQTLFTQTENTWWRVVSIPVEPSRPAHYYRIINQGWPTDLGEIHFYDEDGAEVSGLLIADPVTLTNPDLENVRDGDLLTFSPVESWIGVDFGRPVAISKIEYVPRNDKNGIYPGMRYELLYFDTDGWVSMGMKIATDYSITYDDVPEGALLWLRNRTEGREERIFTYENGRQVWW
jgi:hypothetical protein